MIRKTACYVWTIRDQLLRYGMVGVSTFVLDMATLAFLTEFVGLRPVVSVVFNQLVVVGFNFSLHKYWSFQSKQWQYTELVRYLLLVSWNYLVSVVLMYVFHTGFGYHYLAVRLASIIVIVTWTFFLYKYWVYGRD